MQLLLILIAMKIICIQTEYKVKERGGGGEREKSVSRSNPYYTHTEFRLITAVASVGGSNC